MLNSACDFVVAKLKFQRNSRSFPTKILEWFANLFQATDVLNLRQMLKNLKKDFRRQMRKIELGLDLLALVRQFSPILSAPCKNLG